MGQEGRFAERWCAPYRVETARLFLQALGPEDAEQLAAVIPPNKAHLSASMPWVHQEPMALPARLTLLKGMRANFDLGQDFTYGIFDRRSASYIGGTGLHPRIGPLALEMGYWIAKPFEGRGFVTESVTALVHVAFELMEARRLEVRCNPVNRRSRAIPERMGFHLDGVLREGGIGGDGELEDRMVWSLLASEYPRHPLCSSPRPQAFDVLGSALEFPARAPSG
ncbi:MAG: GNAT family N-acetyltransferase [Holophagales bacterium]|nr:GNAT family N-acetyltransferase [Holophagales bacterium]